jgi:L-fucose isomerase-like protein
VVVDIVVVPLASKVHGPKYYEELLKSVKDVFISNNVKVLNIIDSDEVLSKDVLDMVGNSLPILLILTGGTSRLATKLLSMCGVRRALIIAHEGHNSLPSAISIRGRVEREGIPAYIFLCSDLRGSDCLRTIDTVLRVGKAVAQIVNLKVGVVGSVDDEERELFEEVLNSKVVSISYEELERRVSEVRDEEVLEVLRRFEGSVDVSDLNTDYLRKALKIYVALRGFVEGGGLNALAINCFPYLTKYGVTPCIAVSLLNDDGVVTACEADLRSLTLMLMSKALGRYSWIANLVGVSSKQLKLAHCTIATKLTTRCSVVTHFESGYPYSLTCKLPEGTYTLVGIDRDFSTIATLKVRLLSSGLMSDEMCRTQAVVEADVDLSNFPNIALSNHHILIPGDVVNDLMIISYLLGVESIKYELVVSYG